MERMMIYDLPIMSATEYHAMLERGIAMGGKYESYNSYLNRTVRQQGLKHVFSFIEGDPYHFWIDQYDERCEEVASRYRAYADVGTFDEFIAWLKANEVMFSDEHRIISVYVKSFDDPIIVFLKLRWF